MGSRLPFVASFQPKRNKILWRRQRWNQGQQCRYFCDTITLLLRSGGGESESGSSMGTLSSSSSSYTSVAKTKIIIENTIHLPRLYIDSFSALLSPLSTSSSGDDNNNNIENNIGNIIPLRERAFVPLTTDQEHYLLSVMRITNPKRWGRKRKRKNNNDSFEDDAGDVDFDYTGCVRIFNGIDGEWLAKVVDASISGIGRNNRRQQQRRKRNGAGAGDESGAVLECIEQLLPQQPATKTDNTTVTSCSPSIYNIQLYLGHLKNKQRRKWVFEKATELGTDGITVLQTDYSNHEQSSHYDWKDDRDKHRVHVIEAAEQCERLTVPSISSELWSTEQLMDVIISHNNNNNSNSKNNSRHNHYWLVCRERSKSSPPILSVLQDISDCVSGTNSNKDCGDIETTLINTTIHILIGPEGGWSPGELESFSKLAGSLSSLTQQNDDENCHILQLVEDDDEPKQDTNSLTFTKFLSPVQFVSLGSSVLRAETAAIAAVVAVQMHRQTMTNSN